jgi:hypothetical protein
MNLAFTSFHRDFTMKDLTEKVETLEKRLDDLGDVFDVIRKSLPGGKHGKQRRSVRVEAPSGRPDWVQDIFKCFSEISAELKSVKETLGTRTFTDSGHAQSDACSTYTGAAPDAELQHGAPAPSQSETKLVSPAIPEIGQRKSVTTDRSLPLGHASATASSDHDAIPSQRGEESVHCELALITSTAKPSSLTTQPSNARLQPQLGNETAPTFRCKYKDISKNINEAKFEKLSSDPDVKEKGYFKLVVEDLPPLILDEASVSQPGRDHFTNFSCHRDSQGFVVVTKGQKREVRLPSLPFPQTERSWSRSEQKELWESTIKDPPSNMHYIIGEPLFLDIELSPGKRLERIGGREIRGVGNPYAYLSPGISFSPCHSDDADLASGNLVRAGSSKLWLLIKPAYNRELERRMRREFPDMGHCSQALRHLSRIIPPSKLDEWGVEYSLVYIAPGELMVVQRGTRHQVMNLGPNYALAINILYGPSPDIPLDYRFCETSCGPHALTKAHFRLPEEGPLVEVQGNRRARLQLEKLAVQSKIAGIKRKALPTESQPRKAQVTPQMGSILEVVCGKQAFHQLCSLIYSWRDRSKPFFENNDGRAPAVQLVQTISTLEKRPLLTEFLDRFAKVKLAEIIDKGKEGRTRADPEAIANLINGLGWQNSKTNRTKLHHYLVEGRRWKRICNSFDGLLCLIPPNRRDGESLQISGRVCQELSDKDIELLHSFLKSNEFVQTMCRMGKTFQASIWSNVEVPEFKWESEDPQTIARLPVEDLAAFMEEFPIIEEAEFKAGKYDWPKPDCWLWDWPQSPAWVPPSDKLCDLCDLCEIDKKCNCIITCLPANKPRITNEAGKGQGVRVEGMTYQKGQILEQLAGEFAPLDTYNNGWPMEFRRPDIADEPVAQIYPKEKGNWVRKVNHSCDPSAEFRVMKISGWWRQMLIAIQDIPHNSEVTAFCGRRFLQGKECLCNLCNRRSTLRG